MACDLGTCVVTEFIVVSTLEEQQGPFKVNLAFFLENLQVCNRIE